MHRDPDQAPSNSRRTELRSPSSGITTTDGLSRRRSEHARAGSVAAVYAFVAGAAHAVPVPYVSAAITSSIGGAALRGVAARRGVTLTRSARRTLADVVLPAGPRSPSGSVMWRLRDRLYARVRSLSKTAVVWRAFGAVSLFDAYLGERDFAPTLELEEALRVQVAIERALSETFDHALAAMPREIGDALSHMFEALTRDDPEGRPRVQAATDALLDLVAEVPIDLMEALHARFEVALRGISHSA